MSDAAMPLAREAQVAQIMDWLGQHGLGAARLQADSRQVGAGDVFIAMPGVDAARSADGRQYIEQALRQGAAAMIVEAAGWPQGFAAGAQAAQRAAVPVMAVSQLRAVSAALAARFYDEPSRKLRTVAVTGTNGKTSCTHWIAQGLSLAGQRAAVVGTLGCGFPGQELPWQTGLTTPDAIALQGVLHALLAQQARAVALEASSIGLAQGRLEGMHLDVAVLTNLTRDHLDYHGDMAAYEAAKTKLFDWPSLSAAVINLDDGLGQRLLARLRGRSDEGNFKLLGTTLTQPLPPWPVGLTARFSAQDIAVAPAGMHLRVCFEEPGHAMQSVALSLPLVGRFNVANVLSVFAAWYALDIGLHEAASLAAQLEAPAGRMQLIEQAGAPLVVVDYAHTPDALTAALAALRPLAQVRQGLLWVMFGCGGGRDRGKRALMGQAAGAADQMVITSDNPRDEQPEAIIDDIAAGVDAQAVANGCCVRITDRGQAIDQTIGRAAVADVILLAGKGHEAYQEVRGLRHAFSDAQRARAALAARGQQRP
ncbi:MAG TPA: UDP-N-acetylmuramoyl-L-alanyl-D-glutamate--2,6-diaminopimelate ligase [Burkholderiaceae bacterium]|nr:UDP-N-acetylmuramoyl-L-alanyl-D-glutamate--2,6-diaminopimelate ligase [Burkholderiaceae bacterium]